MPARLQILPSKIKQFDNEHALCEDGSLWVINDDQTNPYTWVCVYPPHEPTTLSSDLEEALDVVESIMTNPENDFQSTCWRRA